MSEVFLQMCWNRYQKIEREMSFFYIKAIIALILFLLSGFLLSSICQPFKDIFWLNGIHIILYIIYCLMFCSLYKLMRPKFKYKQLATTKEWEKWFRTNPPYEVSQEIVSQALVKCLDNNEAITNKRNCYFKIFFNLMEILYFFLAIRILIGLYMNIF